LPPELEIPEKRRFFLAQPATNNHFRYKSSFDTLKPSAALDFALLSAAAQTLACRISLHWELTELTYVCRLGVIPSFKENIWAKMTQEASLRLHIAGKLLWLF